MSGRLNTVGIVVNNFNQSRYLGESIRSCRNQTRPADRILVVDDGSEDDPSEIVDRFPGVDLIRQRNAGLAAARNRGLAAMDCDAIVFLDGDDRLLPGAIEAGLDCLARHPSATLAYGAHRVVDVAGRIASPIWLETVGSEPFLDLLARGNLIAMHACVIYRADRLQRLGGFDETLRLCEDYDLYLRIARHGTIACHDDPVAEYRHHRDNASRDVGAMLAAALDVIDRHSCDAADPRVAAAARRGRARMRSHYCPQIAVDHFKLLLAGRSPREAIKNMASSVSSAPLAVVRSLIGRVARKAVRAMPDPVGRLFGQRLWTPRIGFVNFGDLSRTRPIGTIFGFDRGKPVDRFYIECFLSDNAHHIAGDVLEVGDRAYTVQFGGAAVQRSHILHAHAGNRSAEFVGDLCDPSTLPSDSFDCVVLTQTLHLIYDMRAAVAQLHRALKPGGALLVTVPGISPIEPWEWESTWYWSLTRGALGRLLSEAFEEDRVGVKDYGNVHAAIAFLAGVVTEEIEESKLRVHDKSFPVLVAGVAQKAVAPSEPPPPRARPVDS